jgi:flagellar hook-basal body complex protein FliE
MNVDPVSFLPPLTAIATGTTAPSAAAPEFGAWLSQAVGRVNQDVAKADQALQMLATGQADSLHQVMIALEEARIGVQLLVQVRNRLLDAYQEVLRMQV